MLTIVDLGPRPDEAVEAVRTVLDLGGRRAAELVEHLPAYIGADPAIAEVLREELKRVGAVVEDREPPATPPTTLTDERSVLLVAAGDDKVRVAKAIRLATGVTFAEAKRLVDAAPAPIAVSARAETALRRELEQAGARVG